MQPERIIDQHGNNLHKTQKPIEILLRPILVSSNKNSVVLDATCGLGSTCEAARLLHRNYIGCERDPIYYDYALKRLNRKLPSYSLSLRLQYIIRRLTAVPLIQSKINKY
jgi:modification methylase